MFPTYTIHNEFLLHRKQILHVYVRPNISNTSSFQNIMQYLNEKYNKNNKREKPGSILSRINDAIKQGLKLEWNSKICQIHFFHQFHSNRIFLFLSRPLFSSNGGTSTHNVCYSCPQNEYYFTHIVRSLWRRKAMCVYVCEYCIFVCFVL